MPAFDPAISALHKEAQARSAHLRANAVPMAGLVPDGRDGWYRPGIADLHGLVTSINARHRAEVIRAGDATRRQAWTRTDIWVRAFGGVYRLALPAEQIQELEEKCGRGIVAIVGHVTRDLANGGVSRAECVESLRHALIGGGVAIVDDAEKRIGPREAAEIINGPVDAMPLEEVRALAAEALSARMDGRESAPAEFQVTASTDTPPPYVVPEWARSPGGQA